MKIRVQKEHMQPRAELLAIILIRKRKPLAMVHVVHTIYQELGPVQSEPRAG
jgi:hypothetical protein